MRIMPWFFAYLVALASAFLIVDSRYSYRQLTTQIAQEQQQLTKLNEEKAQLEYQQNLYANPSQISLKATQLGFVEPTADNTLYMHAE